MRGRASDRRYRRQFRRDRAECVPRGRPPGGAAGRTGQFCQPLRRPLGAGLLGLLVIDGWGGDRWARVATKAGVRSLAVRARIHDGVCGAGGGLRFARHSRRGESRRHHQVARRAGGRDGLRVPRIGAVHAARTTHSLVSQGRAVGGAAARHRVRPRLDPVHRPHTGRRVDPVAERGDGLEGSDSRGGVLAGPRATVCRARGVDGALAVRAYVASPPPTGAHAHRRGDAHRAGPALGDRTVDPDHQSAPGLDRRVLGGRMSEPESAQTPSEQPKRFSVDNYAYPRAPRLGVRGWLRWGWRPVTSMRLALVLLLLLGIAAIPGSLLPQWPQNRAKTQSFVDNNPAWGPILDRVGLLDVFGSAWFTSIYVLLFLSLIGCIVPRAIAHGKAARAPVAAAPRSLARYEGRLEGSSPLAPNDAAEALVAWG